jgi:ribonuclease P protein component
MLPKAHRLTAREIQFLQKRRASLFIKGKYFFCFLHNANDTSKAAIVVSKKYHKHAVKRNQLKRRVWHSIDQELRNDIIDNSKKFSLIILLHKTTRYPLTYQEIKEDFKEISKKILRNIQ